MRSYIFVDNSNVFIEGQKAAADAKGSELMGKRYRLDFGRLFAFLTPEGSEAFFTLEEEEFPKLFGSEPPPLDTLWSILKEMGVGVKVFQRNPFGVEKRVDSALIMDFSRLIYKLVEEPDGELVIVAGDADYYDLIFEGEKYGWKVRVVCWERSTANIILDRPEYENLTPHLEEVGFFEKDRFDHDYGDWGTDIDWSKEVPFDE